MKRPNRAVPSIVFFPTLLAALSVALTPVLAGALTGEARQSIEAALGAYEQVRALLAEDRIEKLTEAADRLEQTAGEAARKVAGPLRADLDSLAAAARRLGETPTAQMEEVRRAFGEVSRPVVRLLSAERSLAEGRHVFECPMATGYNKWVQPGPTISNPYMGTQMSWCGAKTEWRE
jgi:hypothetical protein